MKLLIKYLFWAGVISCFIGPVVGIKAFNILLTPSRIISILALPILLLNPTHKKKGIRCFASRVLILMLIYGVASLSWSPDPQLGFKLVTVLFVGNMLFLLVMRHAIDRSVLTKIMIIWSIMIIATSLLGVYELVTKEYLFSFKEDYHDALEYALTSVGWLSPRIFWGNRNEFGFINAVSALVLMGWAFEVRGVSRIIAIISLLLAIIMVMFSFSRAAIFGLIIGIMFFAFIFTIKLKAYYRIVTILLIISLGVFLLYKGENLSFSSKTISAVVTKVETADNRGRIDYYTTAVFQGTKASGGFGRGLGASTKIIEGGSYHHYLLEILAEQGLWIFLGYLILMAKVCSQLWSAIRQGRNIFWSTGLLASCLVFPLLCAGPSSIISVGPYWLWLAFLVSFTEYDSFVMRINKEQLQAKSIKMHSKVFS